MKKISVLIADNHSIVRQGLKQILELEDDIEVVAQVSDTEETIRLAREKQPDIILMDVNMSGMKGMKILEELEKGNNSPRVVVFTGNEDKECLFKTLQLGAEGYILKSSESSMLIDAIRNVSNGDSFIQPNMTKKLIKEFNRISLIRNDVHTENNLTCRETEVLGLIAEGVVNRNIAKKLFISEKTVKNHVSNIFKKLNVSDRTQAAVYAFKNYITG